MRNYKNEAEWKRQRYKQFNAWLLKEDAENLKSILESRQLSFAEWVREKIQQDQKT